MESIRQEILKIDLKNLGKRALGTGDLSVIHIFCEECYRYYKEFPDTCNIVRSFLMTYEQYCPVDVLEEYIPVLCKSLEE